MFPVAQNVAVLLRVLLSFKGDWGEWGPWSTECLSLCQPDPNRYEERFRFRRSSGICSNEEVERLDIRNCSKISSFGCYKDAPFAPGRCGTRDSSDERAMPPYFEFRSMGNVTNNLYPGSSEDTDVMQKRIAGGRETESIRMYPWMAQMVEGSVVRCSGTILSPYMILTAAHCLHDSEKFRVCVGKYYSNPHWKEKYGQCLDVLGYYFYDKHDATGHNYDIAVIILKNLIKFGSRVNRICLPSSKDANLDPSKEVCFIAGWGRTNPVMKEENSMVLQDLYMPLFPDQKCSRSYMQGLFDRKTMMCGQNQYTDFNACYHDSGGPLMCKRPTGEFYIKGVVSWGPFFCGKAIQPTVYARVDTVLGWIHFMMKKEERIRMML